ncbi:MAG TPA: hypothetical protein VEW93_15060 [Acidimicrobiales bacterium]|nr:hypothetical protein [Acidimicrobiales bacterium]
MTLTPSALAWLRSFRPGGHRSRPATWPAPRLGALAGILVTALVWRAVVGAGRLNRPAASVPGR